MEALPPVVDRIMSLFALGIGFPEDFFKKVRRPFHSSPPAVMLNHQQQPLGVLQAPALAGYALCSLQSSHVHMQPRAQQEPAWLESVPAWGGH